MAVVVSNLKKSKKKKKKKKKEREKRNVAVKQLKIPIKYTL